MKISDALANVSRLFLDTAPVIYFVERNPQFVDLVDQIFERLSTDITAVASGITLSEWNGTKKRYSPCSDWFPASRLGTHSGRLRLQ
jgi:hypothetical protein